MYLLIRSYSTFLLFRYSLSGLSSSSPFFDNIPSKIFMQLLYCCNNSLYCLLAGVLSCIAMSLLLTRINGSSRNSFNLCSINTTSEINGSIISFLSSKSLKRLNKTFSLSSNFQKPQKTPFGERLEFPYTPL